MTGSGLQAWDTEAASVAQWAVNVMVRFLSALGTSRTMRWQFLWLRQNVAPYPHSRNSRLTMKTLRLLDG